MSHFSLKTKLLILSVFLILISIIIGAVGHFSLRRVVDRYESITNVSLPNVSSSLQMFANYRRIRIELLHLASGHLSPEEYKKSVDALTEAWGKDVTYDKEYNAVDFLPGEEPLYRAFREAVLASRKTSDRILELSKRDLEQDKAAAVEIQKLALIEMRSFGDVAKKTLDELKKFHFDVAKQTTLDAEAETDRAEYTSFGLLFGCGGLAMAFAWMFSGNLTKTLRAISVALDSSSDQVSSASNEIASSSQQLSQAATEQAAALEETSASIEELNSMVSKNSDNAKNTASSSEESKNQAERGRGVVLEMINSMNQIDQSNTNIMEQINQSNQQMTEIVKVIQEIESKTKVINDIVFQTKLLSFNASVEAARAGEQGKGFAVVAEEVGNLAQMSGNAAKEISDMLANSIKKVESIAQETKSKVETLIATGAEKVKAGTVVAKQCGEVLEEIVGNVAHVSSMAQEISVASNEQSKGIHEITKAMNQLDQVTQTNAATSEEAASAAEELSAQAQSLKDQVRRLVVAIDGGVGNAIVKEPSRFPRVAAKSISTAKTTFSPKGNVVHLKSKHVKRVDSDTSQGIKVAVGDSTPSHNHPDFEEV